MTEAEVPEDFDGAGVVLIDHQGRVLLQQRDDDIPPEGVGRWLTPGGHREGTETRRETALREFLEETGVALERLRFWRDVTRDEFPGLAAARLAFFYADDRVREDEIVVNEGLAFRYWSPAEVASLRINPPARAVLDAFLASDAYRGTVLANAEVVTGVAVLVLDNMGRVLLQLRDPDLPIERHPGQWSLPGGLMEPDEAPDATALREFEEETGVLLDDLHLYRVFHRHDHEWLPVQVQHVYLSETWVEESEIDVREGQAFRYFDLPALLDDHGLPVPHHAREILAAFFESPAYRRRFH